jgi:hypothetical protein
MSFLSRNFSSLLFENVTKISFAKSEIFSRLIFCMYTNENILKNYLPELEKVILENSQKISFKVHYLMPID